MNTIFPQTLEDIKSVWSSLWNKVIDRTVLPLFVSYDKNQVGIGTINPQTYSTTSILVVSGTTTFNGNVNCSGMKLEGSVGSGSGVTSTAGKLYSDCIPAAWGVFTANLGPRSTYNVSSTARSAAGQYTIKFNISMTDTNYLVLVTNCSTAGALANTFINAFNLSATGFALNLLKSDESGYADNDFAFIVYGR